MSLQFQYKRLFIELQQNLFDKTFEAEYYALLLNAWLRYIISSLKVSSVFSYNFNHV